MNLRRKQLLAAAGLSDKQHGRVRGRHLPDLVENPAKSMTLTHDALEPQPVSCLPTRIGRRPVPSRRLDPGHRPAQHLVLNCRALKKIPDRRQVRIITVRTYGGLHGWLQTSGLKAVECPPSTAAGGER